MHNRKSQKWTRKCPGNNHFNGGKWAETAWTTQDVETADTVDEIFKRRPDLDDYWSVQ